jgi:hypothetical protein
VGRQPSVACFISTNADDRHRAANAVPEIPEWPGAALCEEDLTALVQHEGFPGCLLFLCISGPTFYPDTFLSSLERLAHVLRVAICTICVLFSSITSPKELVGLSWTLGDGSAGAQPKVA